MPTVNDKIVSMSSRGQITIPNKLREEVPMRHFTCKVVNGDIVLRPLKTREEFLTELDKAEADWVKKGGIDLDKVKTKYSLK